MEEELLLVLPRGEDGGVGEVTGRKWAMAAPSLHHFYTFHWVGRTAAWAQPFAERTAANLLAWANSEDRYLDPAVFPSQAEEKGIMVQITHPWMATYTSL